VRSQDARCDRELPVPHSGHQVSLLLHRFTLQLCDRHTEPIATLAVEQLLSRGIPDETASAVYFDECFRCIAGGDDLDVHRT
jgi:hypothetical protein